MSRDLKALYQEMILDHNKNPRNFGELSSPTNLAHGSNPLCGDDYFVYVTKKDGVIEQIGFKGHGCAISKASASLMTQMVKGKSEKDVFSMLGCFLDMVTKPEGCSDPCTKELGRLTIFEGVKAFPIRVKCATLIWRALEAALENDLKTTDNDIEITTE